MTPGEGDVWFLPLGGTGEIGMNLNLYGHNGRWLMVDCGITFAGEHEPGPHIQMPDPRFIASRRAELSALIITHAHEDHIGAVAHLWRQLRCPVYTTAFAAEILRRKLAEAGLLSRVPLHIVAPGTRHQLDVFDVDWVSITHSTPQTQALVIRTPPATIFHTADWKIDSQPVVGEAFHPPRFHALGQEGVTAMVCDSTNAMEEGHSVSEGELYQGLFDLVNQAPARVVVACFGSNVARLHTLSRVAEDTGRYAALLGRSLQNFHSAAVAASVWESGRRFINPADLGYLPPQEVLAIATGSQGEPRAALDRLASDTHPHLNLRPDDTVIFSSRVIPGNEHAVQRLTRRLQRLGVKLISAEELNIPIHASGHPGADDLEQLYQWVRPEVAIPVHGEAAHMRANAKIAQRVGVPRQIVGTNGDLFMLAPQRGIRRQAAANGRLGLDKNNLVQVHLNLGST